MRKLAFTSVLVIACSFSHAIANSKLGKYTGLPVPRFVSLKSAQVNGRTGPGFKHPIDWEYTKKGLPVQIIAEYEEWRQIKDFNNDITWIHGSLLSSRRYAITKQDVTAYNNGIFSSYPSMNIQKGVVISVVKCEANRCQLSYKTNSGWVDKSSLWGIKLNEIF